MDIPDCESAGVAFGGPSDHAGAGDGPRPEESEAVGADMLSGMASMARQSINTVFVPMQAPVAERWYQTCIHRVRNCVRARTKRRRGTMIVVRPGRAMYRDDPAAMKPERAGMDSLLDRGGSKQSRALGGNGTRPAGRNLNGSVVIGWCPTLWVLAYGTRVEDASELGIAPGRLRTPPLRRGPLSTPRRTVSVLPLASHG